MLRAVDIIIHVSVVRIHPVAPNTKKAEKFSAFFIPDYF